MKSRIIPIVFACNEVYTLFCYNAIFSLIKYASPKNIYKIYVFVTSVSEKNCKLIESLSNSYVSIHCMDITGFTANITLKGSLHLSIETYYRLFIPLVLPQYEKVLYLDSDLCVFADVADLFNTEIDDYPVAAALDVPCKILQEHARDIGNLDCRRTFNAGVLLINIPVFEKQKIRDKCLKLLLEDYKRKYRKLIFADQDALNLILYGNFKRLDGAWNYQPQFLWRIEDLFEDCRQSYIDSAANSFIMHYAGDKKPWSYPKLPKAETFWNVAKETPVFQDILSLVLNDTAKNKERRSCFEIFQFPYNKVAYGSKVAIYAAGMVGRAFVQQLEQTRYAVVSCWVDKKADKLGNNILEIEALKKIDYDCVIIAIEKKSVADEVINNLKGMGIPQDRIVWNQYRINN